MRNVKQQTMGQWAADAWTIHDSITADVWMYATGQLFHKLRVIFEQFKPEGQ